MLNIKKTLYRTLNPIYLPIWVAIYFVLGFNFPLLLKSFYLFRENGTLLISTGRILILFCFLLSFYISLFSALSIRYIGKPIFIFLILLSSILSYAYIYHSTMFNGHSGMLSAIEHATGQEITALLTPSLFIYFFIFGILPSYLIYKIPRSRSSFRKKIVLKIVGMSLYPVIYLMTSLPSLPVYHPILCESGLAAHIPFQMIPTNFIEEVFTHYKERMLSYIPYKKIGLDAKNGGHSRNGKPNLLVFVVGETARSMNFQLNGYPRKTNPYTTRQNVISFQNVSACSTSTQISLPCIFSSLPRSKFHTLVADREDNLLNILKRAHLNLLWIDNNGAGHCQDVCTRTHNIILHGLDGIIVDKLKQKMNQLQGNDAVVILHLHGSHGPDYYEKYPPKFRKFTPDCRRNDFRFCTQQSLMNAYDNTILYTDYVISEIIHTLEKSSDLWNTALMYTSDHGESLGEGGLYEHCTPYMIAPPEQTQVPLIVWVSQEFSSQKNISLTCLKNLAIQKKYSHDHLFHSILGLMDIKTNIYQNQLDLFDSCREKKSLN